METIDAQHIPHSDPLDQNNLRRHSAAHNVTGVSNPRLKARLSSSTHTRGGGIYTYTDDSQGGSGLDPDLLTSGLSALQITPNRHDAYQAPGEGSLSVTETEVVDLRTEVQDLRRVLQQLRVDRLPDPLEAPPEYTT